METKLVRVPFSADIAKNITDGKVEGRVVTREGKEVRIICIDKKYPDYPIVGLIMVEEGKEQVVCFTYNGNYNKDRQTNDDLFIEIPEYLTFKDGDIFKTSNGSIGIYNANYTPMHGTTPYYVGFRYSDGVLCFCQGNEFGFGLLNECTLYVTETEKQKLIDALKASTEPKAKEYLKRFFGI